MSFKNLFSKQKKADLISYLPDGVLVLTDFCNIEQVNERGAEILNSSETGILNKSFDELVENGSELVIKAAESRKPVIGKILSEDESTNFFIELTATTFEDGFLVCFRDATVNYKKMTSIMVERESSKKINKDKNVFLTKLSNEFKSPMQSIVGFSQAMLDGMGGDINEKQQKYIKIINKNSNELTHFIDKVLELSKIEANMFEYDLQIFDIVNTIQSVVKNNENQIVEKNLNLSVEIDDTLKRTVYLDENAIRTIVQNVFENAIKSTDMGMVGIKLFHPDVEFATSKGLTVNKDSGEKAFLQISIFDSGLGLSESEIETLFDPYSQLDKPKKKNIVRSISFASVKNLVKYLRGVIWVEAQPMQGTVYNILIPSEKVLQVSNE